MSKFLARLVVGMALLYVGGATAFAYTHYEGARPDIPTILAEFNSWLGSLFATKVNPQRPPAAEPPASPPAPAPSAASDPAPATAPAAPAAPGAPAGMSAEGKELWHIQHEVLPKASEMARALRGMSRADSAAFEAARVEILASLGDARSFLNGLLEQDSDHEQANRLWTRLQEIYAAVKKL
jgi:hypothetical protein